MELTEFEVPGGSFVYAYSGTDLDEYGIAFDGTGGGGVLCHDLDCIPGAGGGSGGGTVVPGVPEPETYAMLLAGLGLMGFVARRRQG